MKMQTTQTLTYFCLVCGRFAISRSCDRKTPGAPFDARAITTSTRLHTLQGIQVGTDFHSRTQECVNCISIFLCQLHLSHRSSSPGGKTFARLGHADWLIQHSSSPSRPLLLWQLGCESRHACWACQASRSDATMAYAAAAMILLPNAPRLL